jgi:hypothetical protein
MMTSALLLHCKLVADLCSMGFELNPYDTCVANKMMDGHQMTICWHAMISFLYTRIQRLCPASYWLQACYETPDRPLQATRCALHDLLGINIDFSTPGDVLFNMIPYLAKVLHDFPEKIMEVSSSPAADHLFNIRDPKEAHFLPESQAIVFHHTTAQLLFLLHTCRDIQTAIAVLTMSVECQSSQQR